MNEFCPFYKVGIDHGFWYADLKDMDQKPATSDQKPGTRKP
jgi:glycosidase